MTVFITKFVTLVTNFVIHVSKFVICVTNFVTNSFCAEREKCEADRKKFLGGNEKYLGENGGRIVYRKSLVISAVYGLGAGWNYSPPKINEGAPIMAHPRETG